MLLGLATQRAFHQSDFFQHQPIFCCLVAWTARSRYMNQYQENNLECIVIQRCLTSKTAYTLTECANITTNRISKTTKSKFLGTLSSDSGVEAESLDVHDSWLLSCFTSMIRDSFKNFSRYSCFICHCFHPVLKITSLCVIYLITVKLISKGWRFESRFQCFPVGGCGGMPPQKILKIRRLEMLFSAISVI